MLIELDINGDTVSADVAPATTLVELLRRRGLTDTKDSCSLGECGACSVMIGDRPVLACLTLAARVHAPVRTVEGVAAETRPLREQLADHGAIQCGYCTPGQVITSAYVVAGLRGAVGSTVKAALDGNICRCTGSQPIADAILAHSERSRHGGR